MIGRVMHQNRIARWQGLETDPYALLTHGDVVMSIDRSFVRRGAEVLFTSLVREGLATVAG